MSSTLCLLFNKTELVEELSVDVWLECDSNILNITFCQITCVIELQIISYKYFNNDISTFTEGAVSHITELAPKAP